MLRKPCIACCLALVAAVCRADGPAVENGNEHQSVIKGCTTDKKARVHVIFSETVKSKDQKAWDEGYEATVQLYVDGKLHKSYRGSTLPNSVPPSKKPDWWEYSLVQASCSFPRGLQDRYYTWTWSKRVSTEAAEKRCLRLAPHVPTVNVSSERLMELKRGQFVEYMTGKLDPLKYRYAKDILVHSGYGEDTRGSAGCLTIHPDDANAFLDAVQAALGSHTAGTLEVNRGLQDEVQMQSYCY